MITAIVIDDELMARETIELFINKYTPELKLVGKARSVDEGIQLIKTLNPQIVFLDINMPEKKGFSLFDEIDVGEMKVIFTTAYSEYAVKAINLSATYYLLKPISVVDFRMAVNKTIEKIHKQISDRETISFLKNLLSEKNQYSKQLLVSTKKGYELIRTDYIPYMEGEKNYTWIYTQVKKFLVAKPLKDYEDFLDPNLFFRIHQSFLVNKAFILKVHNTKPDQVELSNGTLINISRDKKKEFMEWLVQ